MGTGLRIGRSSVIRTRDPLLPKQVRYQAALYSDRGTHTRNVGGETGNFHRHGPVSRAGYNVGPAAVQARNPSPGRFVAPPMQSVYVAAHWGVAKW